MKIELRNAGKRFNREWIFRHFNGDFESGHAYAITGINGSGKSTLLQVIATSTIISEGTVCFSDAQPIDADHVYKNISLVAPYLELIEEMTLEELLQFHHDLKPFVPGISVKSIIEILGLQYAANKQLRYFSSGMKQRVKLAQAVFSDVKVILLDEPCTNLDEDGVELYKKLIYEYCKERLVIVSSNEKQEYEFCDQIFKMQDLKLSIN